MFMFQGTPLTLIAFENQIVQVYESNNGHFIYEFTFYDNVFEHSKHGHENANSAKERERKAEE